MMWHDCKINPPKKEGFYLLVYEYYILLDDIMYDNNIIYDRALYQNGKWHLWDNEKWASLEDAEDQDYIPIKWVEIDLSDIK